MDRASKALDQFAKTLGHVTIKYNEAQAFVLFIFSNLLGSERHMAKTLFFSMKSDTGQREMTVALVKALMGEALPDDCREIVGAIENLSSLSGERNAAIHTIWYLDEDDGSPPEYWFVPDPNTVPHRKLKDGDALVQFTELLEKLDAARDRLMLASLKTVRFAH